MIHEVQGQAVTAGLPVVQFDRRPEIVASHYVVSAVDGRGRIADRSALGVLGWAPGHRIVLAVNPRLVVIRGHTGGPAVVTRQGHVRLLAPVRQVLQLAGGDRVMLVARAELDLLFVYPLTVFDQLLRDHGVLPGEVGAP